MRRLPRSLSFFAPLVLCLQPNSTVVFAQSGSSVSAVLSAADYSPSLAPGSIGALFGTSLASSPTGATFDSHGNLPVNLDGASVTVAGISAPLFYVSPTQINFQIPSQTPVGQAAVTVTTSSGTTVLGVATVVPFAPAVFVYGSNRGAVTNAVSGSLEPFDVTDSSIPDGQTRLSIFATGLDATQSTGNAVEVYAQSATLGRTSLVVEYAGPQGYYVGLDQINVVLPAALNGAGDMQFFVQMGLTQSNSVLVRIRSNVGPPIASLSATSGQPQAQIAISGSDFAPDTLGTPAGPRNLVTFEVNGQAATSVVPSAPTTSQLIFGVPYDLQPQGNYLAGTYALCVTTDGRKSCWADPFTIQALQPATGAGTGQIAQQFLASLNDYVSALSGDGLEPATAAAVKSALISSISQIQASIDATLQGSPSYLPAITTSGVQPVLLTTQGIANFEALVANSGINAQVKAMAEKARSRRATDRSLAARSIGPFVSDEQGLLDAAQEYNTLLAAQGVLQDVLNSTVIKVEACALDALTDGGASAVFGAVSSVFSATLYTYELNKIFLKQIDVVPTALTLSPGSQGTFQVQGEFIRGGLAGSIYESTADYLTSLVKDSLSSALGTIDCGDSILGIVFLPTDNILDTVSSSLVNYLLSGPDGQALQTLLDEALQDDNPAVVPLSPASVLSHNLAPNDFQIEFSTPGDSTGTVSANDPTTVPQAALFVTRGLLLPAPGGTVGGELNVQITPSVPPSASVQVSVTGQSGSGSPLMFSVGPGKLLPIRFQATNVLAGTGSIVGYSWLDGQTPIGVTATVNVSLAAGLHHISCVIQSSSGLSSTAEMDVLINLQAGPTVHFSMQDSAGATANDGGSLNESVAQGAQAHIAFQSSVSSSEPIASYAWSVDSKAIGGTANVNAGLSAGIHNIALQVTDSLGSVGTATASVNVVSIGALTAAFNFSGNGQVGQENSVTNYQVSPGGTVPLTMWADRSQGAASYSWGLDATPFNQAETAAVSVAQGSHKISLTVGNGLGATNTATATVIVTQTGTAAAPTAQLSLSAQNQTAGNNGTLALTAPPNGSVMVAFDASASSAGSGTLSAFQWLNNGTVISNQPTFAPAVATPSNSITLKVTNSNGLSGTASAQINVAFGQTSPSSISSISTSPNPPVNGQGFTVTLTGQNFDTSNNTVFFSGPGCSSPCSIGAGGSSTQVSGQDILAAGSFTVTLKNNTTGLTSSGVPLSVQSVGSLQLGFRVMASASGANGAPENCLTLASSCPINVRNAQLALLFQQTGGVHGTIVGGPLYGTADNFPGPWWQIQWDAEPPNQNGQLGYSAESVLALAPLGDVPQPDLSSSYYASTNNIFWPTNAPPDLGSSLGNCTWYAFGRLLELGASPEPLSALRMNASDWATEADGIFMVDSTPAVHSIAQLNSVPNDFSGGHVAVVESLNADGTITVTESSYVPPSPSISSNIWNFLWRHRTVSPTWFSNFIHVPLTGNSVPPPAISGLTPPSYPANYNNQTMLVNGSNFQNGATVTFHDPNGVPYQNKPATFVSSSQLSLPFNNGNTAGNWTLFVTNQDTQTSNTVTFAVTN